MLDELVGQATAPRLEREETARALARGVGTRVCRGHGFLLTELMQWSQLGF